MGEVRIELKPAVLAGSARRGAGVFVGRFVLGVAVAKEEVMFRRVCVIVGVALAAVVVAGRPTGAFAQRADSLSFEIYKDKMEEYRWRLKDADGKVLATA